MQSISETNPPKTNPSEPHDKAAQREKLINDTSNVVSDYLSGIVATNPFVGKLHYGNVIVRRDYEDINQVMILSGSSSGHEPAFAGFVGKGMLTASVHGDLYVEPSAKLIIRTIKELHNAKKSDVLIIIPSSQTECYSFGLAYQRALNESISVRMLCVSDDVVVKANNRVGGLSGVFLVQKIAGAMAEDGKQIHVITSFCEEVVKSMSSVLLCMHPRSSYSQDDCTCKTVKTTYTMEIGVGPLGVTRGEQMPVKSASETAQLLLLELTNPKSPKCIVLKEDVPIVLLLNNLGYMSDMEQAILTNELMSELYKLNISIARVYSGKFYTTPLISGFTVTLLNVNDAILNYLDYSTNATNWQFGQQVTLAKNQLQCIRGKIIPTPRLALIKGPLICTRTSNTLLLVVQFACDALISCEKQLNIMDAEVNDGDTGSRLKAAATEIMALLHAKQINLECPFNFLMSLSKILEGIGGLSGCLYSVMFEAAANSFCNLPQSHTVEPKDWFNCLQLALNAILSFSTVKLGDNTLIDPIAACIDNINMSIIQKEMGPISAFREGVSAAEQCAIRTKSPFRRYPDSGAHAVGIWMRACYEAVKIRCED